MKIKIIKTPSIYDHDVIRFTNDKGVQVKGDGYIGKEDGRVGLVKCPACCRENYAMSVNSGMCCWCGYNLVEEMKVAGTLE